VPCRKAFEMSSFLIDQSKCTAKDKRSRIVAGLITGLNVSL
jgi:hypothetical protein